eukprot:4398032-Amphidinium_carterae.2
MGTLSKRAYIINLRNASQKLYCQLSHTKVAEAFEVPNRQGNNIAMKSKLHTGMIQGFLAQDLGIGHSLDRLKGNWSKPVVSFCLEDLYDIGTGAS